MKFKNIATGTVYNVTNEALISSYEADKRFVKEVEAEPAQDKKTTTKKK